MLALIALRTRPGTPEPIDRDPGIISLLAALYRAVRSLTSPKTTATGTTAVTTA